GVVAGIAAGQPGNGGGVFVRGGGLGGTVAVIGHADIIPAHRIGDGGGDGRFGAVIGEAGGGAPGQRHSQRRNLGGGVSGSRFLTIGKGIVAVFQFHGDGGLFAVPRALVGKSRRSVVVGAGGQA